MELPTAIVELRWVHQEQRMLANERNEARYSHLKEILEAMQAYISLLRRGDNVPSREQTEVTPMDEVSMIQPAKKNKHGAGTVFSSQVLLLMFFCLLLCGQYIRLYSVKGNSMFICKTL